jgi:hypothetical protein
MLERGQPDETMVTRPRNHDLEELVGHLGKVWQSYFIAKRKTYQKMSPMQL